MSIEIIVGLPNLSEGPLLARARSMQVPVLISANCLSRWVKRDGWREWRGWRLGPLANARGLRSIDLDSAGFVLASQLRGIPWTVEDYVDGLAAAYPWRRWASLDQCVEDEIARDREEVLDRIARTVRLNIECHARAVEAGITSTFMPVIQGRRPEDYLRCIDGIAHLLRPDMVVDVGSTCRRPAHGAEGLLAVFSLLDQRLPASIFLHGFGIKGSSLSHLRGLEHRIASCDSQAFGIQARRAAFEAGLRKTNRFVATHGSPNGPQTCWRPPDLAIPAHGSKEKGDAEAGLREPQSNGGRPRLAAATRTFAIESAQPLDGAPTRQDRGRLFMPRTVEITVFDFVELSDDAREKARSWYREGIGEYEWFDCVFDDFEAICDCLGVRLAPVTVRLMGGGMRQKPTIHFSGFWSQGDGACFEARYSYRKDASRKLRDHAPMDAELHRIADELQAAQRRNFYQLHADIRHRGRYTHEYSMAISVERDSPTCQDMTADAEDIVAEAMRDLARWLYRQLESEWTAITADEAVDEEIAANRYAFTADGEIFA